MPLLGLQNITNIAVDEDSSERSISPHDSGVFHFIDATSPKGNSSGLS